MSEPTGPSIDRDEVARFERLAATWWDEAGPMRVLHRFNPVRLAYIRDAACRRLGRDPLGPRPLDGLTIVDVGCGGGVLSEPLARLGAEVTGLDPAPANIRVARAHAEAAGVPVTYRAETIEAVAAGSARFDVVLAMEVVEHVTDMPAFVRAACGAVKPGGLLFAATINRTMRSFALAIVGAEYVLGWLPRGTHDWERFVTPGELTRAVEGGGLSVADVTGVVYNPLTDRWRAARDTAVNYMIAAERPGPAGARDA
ncbi:Ubiquinone biosynthesis O-methyltransferase [Methylobacterium crusticola]|uniref:Ubiquinone biosynthesis O-methyltransferase n=1 Tax=Methylobacterium crusticola TaxID=1697972 RepID=A0ABQ4RA06_9HYPH|nr:bifunctional 2-polyprenyl-6-hydroxyphenol methylase/3-demethylubiquinol 3-O-methyltransferase UbiG [Methylobacterium crusticola]GJD54074.1 Ubiquinone biosynthesis O-methyltransferase [Methylobacterium crusticola]